MGCKGGVWGSLLTGVPSSPKSIAWFMPLCVVALFLRTSVHVQFSVREFTRFQKLSAQKLSLNGKSSTNEPPIIVLLLTKSNDNILRKFDLSNELKISLPGHQ